ncbi:MAG: NAD(P)H-dependent oxidoreductase [Bacteroidia bacterium]|nr:NAD(P)H-dependent oxidoreductase [Bacteroidia bacterium]
MNTPQNPGGREPLRILLFSASLRKESLNTRLIHLAAEAIVKNGGIADLAAMSEFDCPSLNQDLETNDFHPPGALALRNRIMNSDAFMISSPEYNGSMPGFLKNSIDWVSRFRPQPFHERHALLMSASPSMGGGNHGLWSLRIPLEKLGTNVFSSMFSLASAHKAFTPEGRIGDETLAKRFEENIAAFMSMVEASKHYPCMKKAWVEFLGEQPDPLTERVE